MMISKIFYDKCIAQLLYHNTYTDYKSSRLKILNQLYFYHSIFATHYANSLFFIKIVVISPEICVCAVTLEVFVKFIR